MSNQGYTGEVPAGEAAAHGIQYGENKAAFLRK